jgi:predicted nuclease of predicted toxin-antitoxin system
VKFLIDNQLPATLATFLNYKGHECRHVLDVGLATAKDEEIAEYAAEHSLVIVTKDEDFYQRAMNARSGIQVVWVRLGNCRKSLLLAVFDSLLPSIIGALEAGERLIEVR